MFDIARKRVIFKDEADIHGIIIYPYAIVTCYNRGPIERKKSVNADLR